MELECQIVRACPVGAVHGGGLETDVTEQRQDWSVGNIVDVTQDTGRS